ncbi:MAG: PepSY domain-containing protein [Bacteroidales bacterium]|nr:PepSY domain-containing protein [Bacteroidales bacterium]
MGFLRKYHRWGGLILSIFILLFALSGIIMNHRSWFSSSEINRSLLPGNYSYKNWNLAAVKSGIPNSNGYLFYGNIGIWQSNSGLNSMQQVSVGTKPGIDSQKTFKLIRGSDGNLLAAGLYGLYFSDDEGLSWQEVKIEGESHPVDIAEYQHQYYILMRSEIIVLNQDFSLVKTLVPAPPMGYDNTISLFRTLWEIHSGEFLGISGKLFVDLLGLIFIFLSISGIIYFFAPNLIKRLKNQSKKRFVKFNRKNLKWHNYIGLFAGIFLIFTVLTGMFLRPPLLIPISNVNVQKIPYTHLDHPNPWYDKLRTLFIDAKTGAVVLGTNEGLYLSDLSFAKIQMPASQPPVSVMGINVFERLDENIYLVGSFNGLFVWNPSTGMIMDYINRQTYIPEPVRGSPISAHMIAGYMRFPSGYEVVFDYNRGAEILGMNQQTWIPMPEAVTNSGMSLWNLALEVHTGRIYESILGDFYILFIPLAGLNILLLLISGIIVWFKHYYKK